MIQSLLLLATLIAWSSPATAALHFQCSWENAKPITITVDEKHMKAFRDDGGRSSTVIKLTRYAVWLLMDDPENIGGAAIQMIQRGMASTPSEDIDATRPYKVGKWVDIVISMTGAVSPIVGGQCWENK